MALYPLNPVVPALGAFDMLDTELGSIKGGEVMTFTTAAKANSSTEAAAADVTDGYTGNNVRVVATFATSAAQFPLYLSDEGNSPDYSTMIGQVVGASVGLFTSGAVVGPHTALASGKVTLWGTAGLYLVTLDACATDFISKLETAGTSLSPGASLGFNATGKLSHSLCTGAVSASGVAHFIEYEGGTKTGSLVTTSPLYVGATVNYDKVKVSFHAGLGVRTL